MTQYSLRDRLFMEMMAREAAERHRTPKAEFQHPQGVIVPNNPFMTEKISDPDYVPYCGPCSPMQRIRRVRDGFQCPACGNKANWDLTKFNHNVNVQFDPERMDDLARQFVKDSEEVGEGLIEDTIARTTEKAVEHLLHLGKTEWLDDKGKKNTSVHNCGKCAKPFFGKKSRKYCKPCQEQITARFQPTPNHLSGNPQDWGPAVERAKERESRKYEKRIRGYR